MPTRTFLSSIPASAGTLPGNARRVDSCPEAHNITAWKEASIRLNCSDDIRKKALYHCLPSSYLNETIEFCASNAAIDEESSECRNKQEDNDTSKREFVKQERKDSILNTGGSQSGVFPMLNIYLPIKERKLMCMVD
uniref:Uncharacterized protein n=1 Tax=Magallana gigas TaxID=29159 RepID=K1QQ01_MAGGI